MHDLGEIAQKCSKTGGQVEHTYFVSIKTSSLIVSTNKEVNTIVLCVVLDDLSLESAVPSLDWHARHKCSPKG